MVDNANFKYQTSKILQLLYEAGKSGLINEEERVSLKGNFDKITICTKIIELK